MPTIILHIYLFRNDYNKINWFFVMKIIPKNYFQLVHNNNDEIIEEENIFQLDEIVNSYQVILFIELKEDLNFHTTMNIYVHIDIEY